MTERPVDTQLVRRPVVHLDLQLGRRDVAAPFALDVSIDECFHLLRERQDIPAMERCLVEVAQSHTTIHQRSRDGERNAELRVNNGARGLAHLDWSADRFVCLSVHPDANATNALSADVG